MLILNKNIKDYYDWYCSILGVDETVVYDRRNYHVLGGDSYMQPMRDIFSPTPVFDDRVKIPIQSQYNAQSIVRRLKIKEEKEKTSSWKKQIKISHTPSQASEGVIYHVILEAGNTHYCFEVERYLDEKDPKKICHIDGTLIRVKENVTKRYGGECPLSIIPLYHISSYALISSDWEYSKKHERYIVNNPILANTFIPSFIPAEEIWRRIYDYISSLKDKPIVDSRTNNEHIESAGFDKKNSFRPKKKS